MATRFYLPDAGTAPVTPPAIPSGWEQAAGYTVWPTDVVKTNSPLGAGAPRAKGSTTAWQDRLDRVYVSTKQLAAQTISAGTLSAVIRAIESATGLDAYLQIMVRVVSADGQTERGVLYGGSTQTAVVTSTGAENQEYGTTSSTRIKNGVATSAVTVQDGDRIQIEIGYRAGGTTSSQTATHRYGDATATADFALTAALTTDLCPWVELSGNLTWRTPTGTADGSWSFAGDAVGTTPPVTANGVVSGAWSFTGAAVGQKDVAATVAGSWSFTGAAVGSKTSSGAVAGAWSFAGAAVGSRVPQGTVVGSWSFTGAAAGQKNVSASIAGSWSFAGAAVGSRVPQGALVGSWSFAGAAVGTAPVMPSVLGIVTGAWSFAGAAVGSRVPQGTVVGSWSFTGAAAGQKNVSASIAGSWSFAGVAVGSRSANGVGTPGTFTFTQIGAVGSRVSLGTVAGGWTFTAGTAAGSRESRGLPVGTWTFHGEAVGSAIEFLQVTKPVSAEFIHDGSAVVSFELHVATAAFNDDGMAEAEFLAHVVAAAFNTDGVATVTYTGDGASTGSFATDGVGVGSFD